MTKRREDLNSQDRKDRPVFSGVLKYFPDALLEVAELSRIANEKHNPGQPLHWSKGKSNDHGDALVRHQLDAGKWDDLEGHRVRHSAEVAWRALAQLQTEIENEQGKPPYSITETVSGTKEEVNAYLTKQGETQRIADCVRTGGEWRNGNCYTKTQPDPTPPRDPAYEYNGDFGALAFEGTPFKEGGKEPWKGLEKDDCLRMGYVWNSRKGCRGRL